MARQTSDLTMALVVASLGIVCCASASLLWFGSGVRPEEQRLLVIVCCYLFAIYLLLLAHLSKPGGGP